MAGVQYGIGMRTPRLEIRRLEPDYCEFLLTGTDASVANALRRVILAEVITLLSGLDQDEIIVFIFG